MFANIVLGVLAGAGLTRLAFRFHRRRHAMGGWGGHHGWHGCGGGRRGFGHGFGHGHGHGRKLFWLVRELGLDSAQRDEVKKIWLSVREAVAAVRFDTFSEVTELGAIAVAEPLDRVRLDELAARHAESHAQAAKQVAQALARLHEVLRPEQRARVREHLARFCNIVPGATPPPPAGPAGGTPYRDPVQV